MIARLIAATALLALVLGIAGQATAGEPFREFPPPQGKGRVVVIASGMSGPDHYAAAAKAIAALGYDAVLFDGNPMEGTHGAGLLSAIESAKSAPHGLPGKVALVGFSLGGGIVLYYGSQHPELAVGVVAWYPATAVIRNVPDYASRIQTPVVMFAGGADNYRDGCCLAAKAQVIATAAAAAGKSFTLTVYPGVDHDFVIDGSHYDRAAYDDAMRRTAAALTSFFAQP
ncbi:MAG TPA: dienelactone hydrolase family protein [Caulobacteraceae bacterium]|nr:dienelactone hydrolase family protein [Caulobacteraceae bacterium]